MTKTLLLLTLLFAGACSLAPGEDKSICDENPSACASVRDAYMVSNGLQTPRPSDAALQRGEIMRVYVAPVRQPNGTLNLSGHVFLE